MKSKSNTIFSVALFATFSVWAQHSTTISIPPLEKSAPKFLMKAKKEKISLSGPLRTIPMGGAKTTIQSSNFGQVVLFAPMVLDLEIQKQLEQLEIDGVHVKVTGVLATVCSDSELKAEVMGCRWLDTSKPITVEKQ